MQATGWLGSPAFLDFGLLGGCARGRLDHSCKIPPREAALAADVITATVRLAKIEQKTFEK